MKTKSFGEVQLNIKELPDGRVCIHWLIEGEGPIKMHSGLLRQALKLPTEYAARIACNPAQNTVNPQRHGQEILMCIHSNDIRAVTCPNCLETADAKEELAKYQVAEAVKAG